MKDGGRWLDYACGDGKLSEILLGDHGRRLLRYERYMESREGYLGESELQSGSFDLVVTTSVFEHLTRREHFDSIAALVGPQGVLGIHTLVCEEVPEDPMWFYMNPVHCAFHTNRSMELLLGQWGYTCSVYNVEAKLWLCFKGDPREIRERVGEANRRLQRLSCVFKEGFVDYWKGSPLRRAFGEAEWEAQRRNPAMGQAYAGEALR